MIKILILTIAVGLLSCEDSKLKNKISNLNQKVSELELEKSQLETENKYLEKKKVEHELKIKQLKYIDSQAIRVEKMTKYGYTRVYGAQNAIEFLSDNYCTHFDYVVDRKTRDYRMSNPIIIK